MSGQVETKQSRLGKKPIPIPQGVEVKIDGQQVSLKGKQGSATRRIPNEVDVKQQEGALVVALKPNTGARGPQFQGLTRALLAGLVEGVSNGYTRSLDLVGVGYRAEVKGDLLVVSAGLSHQVEIKLNPAVKCKVEQIDEGGQKRPRVHLSSHDKELLGHAAARVRACRPPEPYKGKGIRYTGERIREKAGKAAAKGS